MRVRIGRDELLTGLQRVQGVVEKRNTMPILSNILLEARQDGAEIVATDLEIGMRGLYKATVLKTGGVTLSARKLFEIIAPKMGILYDAAAIDYLIETHYKAVQRPFRNCQPRDLLLQVRNYATYKKLPKRMSPEAFDFAVENYFSVM